MLDLLHGSTILIYVPLIGNMLLALVAGGSAATRRPLPAWFWTATLLVIAVLAIQAAAGLILLAAGARPRRGLHVMYGVLVAGAAVVQYGLRPGGFLRRRYGAAFEASEARTVALICLTQFALIARGWMTGT
jgi:hypothetical protein